MSSEVVRIYGKDTCPHTTAAREAYAKQGVSVEYRNVKVNPKDLEEMLQLSQGERRVPIIVEGGKVSIGWMGKG